MTRGRRGDAERARSAWAQLIHKVYEVDPLVCAKRGAPMHVIALIDDATVIRRILEHLGLWAPRHARQNQRAPPGDRKGIDGSKPPVREWTYHPVPQTSPELLNEGNAPDQPGRRAELALRRRLELIAQQVATKLAPIAPAGGAQRSEIDIMCIARASRRVQAQDCGALESRSDFAAGLIRLSLGIRHRYEEFDDDHSDIDYRMDVSLPFLYRALR